MKTYSGGCHCGAVRYEARGEAINVRACHCASCRKAAGGPFHVRAIFPIGAVSRHGLTERYRSSARLLRLFCPVCSTYLFGEPIDRPGYMSINVDSLDDPSALAPEMHIWVESKIAWVMLDDGLPQHEQGAPW
jgi:hypothetical protein